MLSRAEKEQGAFREPRMRRQTEGEGSEQAQTEPESRGQASGAGVAQQPPLTAARQGSTSV